MSPIPHPPLAYTAPARRPGTVTAVAVISVLMGIFCGCGSIYTIALPAMMEMQKKMFSSIQAQAEGDFSKQKTQRLEDLRGQRETAASPEEQQRLDAEMQREEARQMPDMGKMMTAMMPPESKMFYVALGIVGVVVNLLFLVSGIGLFPMMEWARKLNLTTSVVQIVVMIGSTIYTIAVVSPAMMRGMQEMMEEIQKSMPPGETVPALDQMNTMIQVFTGIFWGAFSLVICGWLVAAICMLRTARVKEAFRARAAMRASPARA